MAKNEENTAAMAANLTTEEAAPDWRQEIKAAFDASVAEAERPDEDAVETPPVAEAVVEEGEADLDDAPAEAEEQDETGSQGRDDKGKFTKRAPISDALLERAVKAGIPMSEARQYPTEALLSATCARQEVVQKAGGAEAKPGDVKKDGEAKPADPVAAIEAIPDLSPEVYDPQLVKAFGALKGIALAQSRELAELRGKGSKDFMATQLEGVKEFTKGDQSRETAVREKFDTLKAGYRATNKDVSDVTVFAEAAQLVLGGDMKAKAKQDKVEAAGQRSAQRISRAAGQRVEAKADPVQGVVDKIQAKFFNS